MIVNQLKNRSFRTTDEYVVNKEKAEIIDTNMLGDSPRDRTKEVAACRRYRPKLERACGHVVFSLPHREDESGNAIYHESLTNSEAIEFVSKWREEMKVTNCLHFLARHRDKEHEHFHLVFCRIRKDGSVIDDGWDYYRSQPVVRKLEKEFGLEVQLNSWEVGHRAQTKKQKHHSSGELPVTKKLEQLINAATADKPTVTQAIARLQQQGVTVRPTFSTRGLFKKAISFEFEGVPVAGNKLGKAYSFPGLQKWLGVQYDPDRDMPALIAAAAGELVLIPESEITPLEVEDTDGDEEAGGDEDAGGDRSGATGKTEINSEMVPLTLEDVERDEEAGGDEDADGVRAGATGKTEINSQQRLLAEAIYPITRKAFIHGLKKQVVLDVSPDIKELTETNYRLVRYEQTKTSVVEALDGRGELIRYVDGNLTLAHNLQQQDLEYWKDIEKSLNQAAAEQREESERQHQQARQQKEKQPGRGFDIGD